jgi:rhamnose utilization protein RhaD (predicted bifunctional aldolase and dehydrogenase)
LALARALGDVVSRIEPGADLSRLSAAQEAALLNWDAEKYRQSLEAQR